MLRNYARRELHILEREGDARSKGGEVADLVDEVLTAAWEQFASTPRHLPLDLWLIELLDEVLEQWVKEEPRPHVSLEAKVDEVLPARAIRKEEPEWWADLLGEEEKVRWKSRSRIGKQWKAGTSWGQTSSGTAAVPAGATAGCPVAGLLAARPAKLRHGRDRHASNRPEGQVKADIEAARRTLGERLTAGGQVQAVGESAAS